MIPIERVVALSLDELDERETEEVEEHILSCGACATTLERLLRLGESVRVLVHNGGFAFPVTGSLAEALARAGLVSRSYRLAPEVPTPCSVDAHDLYALTTLEADLRDVKQASLTIVHPLGKVVMDDVPFDAEHGLVRYTVRSSALRNLPSGRVTIELHATAPATRLVGRYLLDHTAFRRV